MLKQRGFTLIELMVAVALLGMLLSMAVPALNQFTNNARQTGAINDFVASMHMARSTAVTTNSRVTVCASSNQRTCEVVPWDQGWIAFTDPNNNGFVDGNDQVVAASQGIDGLAIASGEFGLSLQYRPNGRVINAGANGTAGQFTVCDDRGDEYAKVLIIDLSGRPRVSKYLADGSTPNCM
jgi:type IV fimbrial biogenesis protein FimT